MITTLTDTTAGAIDRTMSEMRSTFGANSLGRVLTLIIVTPSAEFDDALEAAVQAGHEHPSRVIVLHIDEDRRGSSLDAEIRVGRDAGAGEIIIVTTGPESLAQLDTLVTPLLLPDAPIVTWWPTNPPSSPINDILGGMSQRRITDAAAQDNALDVMQRLRTGYAKGDSDLSWARITRWRGLLASAYEVPPVTVPTSISISGDPDNPTVALMAAWLEKTLGVTPTITQADADGFGLREVRLARTDGDIVLRRDGDAILLTLPQDRDKEPQRVAVPHRSLYELIAEELRRLDPDVVYGEVLAYAFPRVHNPREFVASYPKATTRVSPTSDELAVTAANEIARALRDAITQRGVAHLALTGGGAGVAVAEQLPSALAQYEVDTTALHLWWGDERFVEAHSQERNDVAVEKGLLQVLQLPSEQVHRVPAAGMGMTLDQAAAWYGQQLDLAGGDVPFHSDGEAFFDVLMLGMGPDAHVASLFPEHPDQKRMNASAIAVRNSPKPPSERVSLSWPALTSARHVAVLVSGSEKADAVAKALSSQDPWLVPASTARGTESTVFYLDTEAAAQLSE